MQFDQATEDLIAAAPAPEVLAKSTLMLIRGEIPGRTLEMSDFGVETKCGTTACFAGNAVMEAGFLPADTYTGDLWGSVRAHEGGERAYTYDVAQRLLGLTDREAKRLFLHTGNDDIEDAILKCWPELA